MSKHRIVVKVGSNVLTRNDGKLDITRMSAIVDQVAWLHAMGYEVVLVSSGAVASGRGEVKVSRRLDSVAQRQLFSALGQAKLINHYYDLFREYRLPVGQVLTINENDTVSVTELMFTDNDELSGLIASMMGAEALIILSNIDGIYNGPPDDPASRVITQVEPGTDLGEYIQTGRSGFGRGGMATKYNIARKVAEEGIRVVIANGKRDNILIDLVEQPADTPHTEFTPTPGGVTGIKKWIAHSDSFAKGRLTINDRAAEALSGHRAVSLLPVGVTAVEGDFEEGDLVSITDQQGTRLAIGRTAYDSDTARQLMGQHDQKPIIHYDYLYME